MLLARAALYRDRVEKSSDVPPTDDYVSRHFSGADALKYLDLTETKLRLPELNGFRNAWLYVIGLIVAVTLILTYFTLHPTAETPPFP